MMRAGDPDTGEMKYISLLTSAYLIPQEMFSSDKVIAGNSLAKVIKLLGHEARQRRNLIHTERGCKI